MTREDIENKLLPFVDFFALGLAEHLSYRDFEAMKDALMTLCVLCYKEGQVAATINDLEKLKKLRSSEQ